MELNVRREPVVSLFDELFSDFFNRGGWPVAARSANLLSVTRARMDVVDKGLPGVRKEDIRVSIEGARVSIAAETKGEKETKDGDRVLHTERYATSYARSFELPVEVTEDNADAKYENGVLTLALPKRAAVSARRLTIK
jgi:HSP20 family protein